MRIRFLIIEDDRIVLLGYPLRLSPSERKLLVYIAENGGADIDSLSSLLGSGVKRGNVAVHINSINKKAFDISGRKLILFEDSQYNINPHM